MQILCPEQKGQPLGLPDRVRLFGVASHSCALPHDEQASGHSHQTLTMLPAVKSSGRLSPFLVGCHCCVISGRVTARDGRPPYVLLPDAADLTADTKFCQGTAAVNKRQSTGYIHH